MKRRAPAFALILAAGGATAGTAIDESALAACRAEEDDARRLACYDRVVGGAPESTPPSATTASPATAPPAAEDRFGRERAIAHAEQQRTRRETKEIGKLNALVADIEIRIDGLMTITLDNGQVWRQSRPDSMFRLKVGDAIKIQPAALNSYLMTGPTNRSTRVTRVE